MLRTFVILFQLAVVGCMGYMGWAFFKGGFSPAALAQAACQGNPSTTVTSTAYDPQTGTTVTYRVEQHCEHVTPAAPVVTARVAP